MLTQLVRLRLLTWANLHVRLKSTTAPTGKTWSSAEARTAFIKYFEQQDHLFVPSSSVIPNKVQGTYFTNAGMNQASTKIVLCIQCDKLISLYVHVGVDVCNCNKNTFATVGKVLAHEQASSDLLKIISSFRISSRKVS